MDPSPACHPICSIHLLSRVNHPHRLSPYVSLAYSAKTGKKTVDVQSIAHMRRGGMGAAIKRITLSLSKDNEQIRPSCFLRYILAGYGQYWQRIVVGVWAARERNAGVFHTALGGNNAICQLILITSEAHPLLFPCRTRTLACTKAHTL